MWQWEGDNSGWGVRSIDRVANVVGRTNISVQVQVALRGGATSFRLQDWSLVSQIV